MRARRRRRAKRRSASSRAVADPDNVEAEFAIIVRSDLKGRGLGRLLLEKMIAYLAGRGTQRMVGLVLRENQAMRDLAQALGFVRVPSEEESSDVFHVVKMLDEPAPGA